MSQETEQSKQTLCDQITFAIPKPNGDAVKTLFHIVDERSTPQNTVVSLGPGYPRILPAAMCRESGFEVGRRIRSRGEVLVKISRSEGCRRKCDTTEGCMVKPSTDEKK